MNLSYFGKLMGALVVAAGLMLGLLSGTSSAQVMGSVPRAHVNADQAEQVGTQGSASSYGMQTQGSASSYSADTSASYPAKPGSSNSAQLGTFSACGWSNPIYRHCGQNLHVLVRVDFAWSFDERDIWVPKGETNLVALTGRQISYAWCIQNCG